MKKSNLKNRIANLETELNRVRNQMDDMHGFIVWAMENGKQELIGPTLSHDIAGILNYVRCWTPRSSGYALVAALGLKPAPPSEAKP